MTGTKAQANKFHDDKDQYTGVHARGGPSVVDTDKIADIGQILDRTEADVRGRKIEKKPEADSLLHRKSMNASKTEELIS